MSKQHRLLKLYEFMSRLPSAVIDMDSWRSQNGKANIKISNKTLRAAIENPGCGTQACALGWACSIPAFKADGLQYEKVSDTFWEPRYQGHTTFDAAEAFFDITSDQSEFLFNVVDEETGDSHKQVFLTRIRQVMVEENIITKKESIGMRIAELQREYDDML